MIRLFYFFVIFAFAFASTAWGSNCSRTSVGFIPLFDMGASDQYLGEDGMLYPGSNTCPPTHMANVMAAANNIVPLDAAGNPSPSGEIVWFSCGMSNTNGKTNSLIPMMNADPLKAPKVHPVNGANGGIPVEDMVNPTADYWVNTIPQKLSAGGVTAEQVQVVWLLQTHRGPSGPFGTWYLNLRDDLGHVCRNLYTTFPNLKIIYVSPRSYAGYADGTLNPEPYAYQSGFSYKKLIDDQLSGDSTLNWNPAAGPVQTSLIYWSEYLYIWADGMNVDSMGQYYQCSHYNSEGTHPSSSGYDWIAAYLLKFYQTDPTAVWYRGTGSPPTSSPTPTSSSPASTSQGGGGGQQCYSYSGKTACLSDCECGACKGGQDPVKGCVPVGLHSQCTGSWLNPYPDCVWLTHSQGGSLTTSSQPPVPTTSTTQIPVPTTSTTQIPVPTTTTQAPPPPPPTTSTQGGGFDCSVYNGNAQGCMGDCRCGYCPTIDGGCGCLTGDASGPDSVHGCTCSGNWQFFGPC